MALPFNRNTKTISVIYEDFTRGRLVVDSSYQRRSVWNIQDKVRLIETILLDLIIPEVFFWPAAIDAESGKTYEHIVDGQQRLNAIIEFISGRDDKDDVFILANKYLLNDDIMERCGNKSFAELGEEDKKRIWRYQISVVEIDASFKKADITQMFYRLNLTNYSLNAQEKRNSQESAFGDAAEALSTLDFWKECKVFSSVDAKRMRDIEYCCSIYILANEGVVDQTNSKIINTYYDDYEVEFDSDKTLFKKIDKAIDTISRLRDKTTQTFISKKAQMYTLFSLMFKLYDNQIAYTDELFERFKLFVSAYNCFRNEFNIEFRDGALQKLNEDINKYKLASSEGINKIGNRVIRLEIIYKICVEGDVSIKRNLKELEKIYKAQDEGDKIKFIAFDEEDFTDMSELE